MIVLDLSWKILFSHLQYLPYFAKLFFFKGRVSLYFRFLAFRHAVASITLSGLSYMQICVGCRVITVLVCSRAISWLRALKQLNFAPPPPQQSFADVLGEI